MPLFSEHISNMYYGGSPSYTSPSYGYKSSYNPLGTSYSASYLSPGGSYSNHSSLSSYSRAPLTSHRWIPGISRSYSPMLTPISERGAASPIRINSPRRIPISKRCYGTSSYIQRPININTESIDVSRDRYRPKPEEPPPRPPRASLPQPDEPVKDNENSPFMPRIDGKPETGIDSSPGIQRSTIKRGRTVVRFHTIKRKDKDSPRKPLDTSQSQDSEIKKQDALNNLEGAVMPEEAKESLSWREKLSEDLIYVDKKEKKSLGTKLVEKFIVAEKDKSEIKIGVDSEVVKIAPGSLSLQSEVASTSKSPDRRYSMELLAEQSSLFDSLIRGENLSTATLDLSKVGITDETKNKLVSSDSIKRRKTDDKGNPLKTTKSDHSLHDNLSKSLRGTKDPKVFTKRRSLKKSQSGGSIHRLDSITEFPKENVHVDLPIIQENKFSPKQIKTEPKPKLRTKITATVEVSPPTSPLKFRIENVTVEEKHHTPKKEISFSYDVDETSDIQDVTIQSPKTTLKRCKERNSVKKKSKKDGNNPKSPEPDDGNFWAKIGKRETIYLIHRKQNIEAAKEKNQKSHLWFNEEEESKDIRDDSSTNNYDVITEKSNDSFVLLNSDAVSSDLPLDSEANKNIASDNVGETRKGILKTISTKLEKSKSSDYMVSMNTDSHNLSLKEKTTMPIVEQKVQIPIGNKTEIFSKDTKVKTDVTYFPEEKNKTKNVASDLKLNVIKQFDTGSTNLDTSEIQSKEISNTIFPVDKPNSSTDLRENIPKSNEKCTDPSLPAEILIQAKTYNLTEKIKSVTENTIDKKDLSPITQRIDTTKANIDLDLCTEASTENIESLLIITEPMAKTETKIDKNVEKTIKLTPEKIETIQTDNDNVGAHLSSNIEIKPVDGKLISQDTVKSVDKEDVSSIDGTKINVDLNLSIKTKPTVFTAAIIKAQVKCPVKDKISLTDDTLKNKPITASTPNVSESLLATPTELKAKVNSVSSLQTQAKSKTLLSTESKSPESLAKHKQTETVEDIKKTVNKQINPESTKKSELTETNSKKKIKKVLVKVSDKNIDAKTEKVSSAQKENICDTCKKSLASSSSSAKTSKLIVERVVEPSTSKQLQEKDKSNKIEAKAEKPINNVQLAKSDLNSTTANLSKNDSSLETSVSTSQIPVVIETKDIPSNTVVSNTNQLQTSDTQQEKTGEENKADKDTKGDGELILKQTSIKEIKPKTKKPIKEEKPAKPLIATPRPLLKRAPQVIHSDSSESSSEEDSSEEEEVSDASENSGEFYECENNPDGRTSTGSNDSGFDSSAPTSPASFLQIKKGAGDSAGPSSSNASAPLPAPDVVDSELELEQSTVYGLYRKTGRFTPPARSIPRFRKYNIEDFQFIKVLGKGSFGKVLLAELRDTEYYYAVKCLKKDVVLEDDDVECTLIERKVLALGTNHPYLCHLFATFQTDSHLFFVMEYLNGGDLMFHIQQSGRFPEPRARFYAAEIVSGLKFLHKRGIVYRDLKLDNILLDFDGHVRIADFGMCKLQIYLDKTADTFCGTPDYMAPEIIKGLKYNQTVDWWSFGVLLYEMLIGQSPFSGCDEDELFWSICNEMPSYPRFLSSESLTILTRLLDKDARTRLGGTECMHGDVREQDFFHAVHWDKLERRELETPFKPRVRHPLDTQYFDRAFTGERPRLTAVEPHVLRSMDQEPFRGFSYTNPNATDR